MKIFTKCDRVTHRKRLLLTIVPSAFFVLFLSSCTYLKYASIQNGYKRIQQSDPSQLNLKHMIDHQSYYVVGETLDPENRYAELQLAIIAYSNQIRRYERVDTMHFATAGTHFGLNLPEGNYELVVLADLNRNGQYEGNECVAQHAVALTSSSTSDNIQGRLSLKLGQSRTLDWVESISVPIRPEARKSVYYPGNAIRSLDDPIFDPGMATIGMYDPASFLEVAPTLFYALEEDLAYKIPIVFVHGIGGTPRSFKPMLDLLDRSRYRPWFFYYPSGGDLNQQAEMFYRIFLSGKLVGKTEQPLIVVAHSMGGIVVREALNLYEGSEAENRVKLFISIASPFNGHAASAMGEKHGLLVLPAWRDLNPQNEFITQLFRRALPDFTKHHLIYAFQNDGLLKTGENSDGTVSLASQLRPHAQEGSVAQLGIDNNHTGILEDPALLRYFITQLGTVQNFLPDDHLAVLESGGFKVDATESFDPVSKYEIEQYGRYLFALSQGHIEPIHPDQERFLEVASGINSPRSRLEKAWIRYVKMQPELSITGP